MANYRSLVPGGYFSSPDQAGKVNASIWSNNPGAINGNARWVQESPGFVKTITIGGGNPIAVFETPEQGVALWLNLLKRYRANGYKTVQGIVNHYGGGQDYSAYVKFVVDKTGFARNKEIDLADDKTLLPFFRAMCHYEAGKPSPLSDAQALYGFRLARGTASADVPAQAPRHRGADFLAWLLGALLGLFKRRRPATPGAAPADFAARVVAAMRKKGIPVDEGDDVVNIVYVEGVDDEPAGKPNANRRDAFDDLRCVIRVTKDGAELLGRWQATIETGVYYTENPVSDAAAKGAARIVWGHQKCWNIGHHRGYVALAQTGGKCSVYRDKNKDYIREGDEITTGWYGINQHHGGNAPRDNIGYHSAGCLVGRMVKGHEEFMGLLKSDRRERAAPGQFIWGTTVMPREWLS